MNPINDELKNEILNKMTQPAPELPASLSDERLEPAFKTPVTNEEGYSDPIPAIWGVDKYFEHPNGVLMLDSSCATVASRLYSHYLDEPALVWDAACDKLYLYRPRPDSPKLAFKGCRWMWSGKLKPECAGLRLKEVYLELSEGRSKKYKLK